MSPVSANVLKSEPELHVVWIKLFLLTKGLLRSIDWSIFDKLASSIPMLRKVVLLLRYDAYDRRDFTEADVSNQIHLPVLRLKLSEDLQVKKW